MNFHPVVECFPAMGEKEFALLRDSINDIGQIVPIWTWEGMIVDGRSRYLSCLELKIAPLMQAIGTKATLPEDVMIDRVIAINVTGRFLSERDIQSVHIRASRLYEKLIKTNIKKSNSKAFIEDIELLIRENRLTPNEAISAMEQVRRYLEDI